MSPEADPPIVSPIQLAYNWAVATCEAPNVGYSQAYRNQQTVDGITYYDCSSFIWYALKAGGYPVVEQYGSWPFTTYTMGRCLESLGFTRYDSSQVAWLPGDIVVFKGDISQGTGHTEMVYDGYRTMGAHNSHLDLPDQVSINNYNSSPSTFPDLYRSPEGPIPPGPIGNRLPVWLIKKALENGGII